MNMDAKKVLIVLMSHLNDHNKVIMQNKRKITFFSDYLDEIISSKIEHRMAYLIEFEQISKYVESIENLKQKIDIN